MTIAISRAGAWSTISAASVYRTGAWRTIVSGYIYKSGAWKQFASFIPPLAASLSTTFVTGRDNSGFHYAYSAAVTVTPSGGVPPYTYSWIKDSGVGYAVSPAAAITQFYSAVSNYAIADSTFHVIVTDSVGASVSSATVTAEFYGYEPGGFS